MNKYQFNHDSWWGLSIRIDSSRYRTKKICLSQGGGAVLRHYQSSELVVKPQNLSRVELLYCAQLCLRY